jgi:hypothetical protein
VGAAEQEIILELHLEELAVVVEGQVMERLAQLRATLTLEAVAVEDTAIQRVNQVRQEVLELLLFVTRTRPDKKLMAET